MSIGGAKIREWRRKQGLTLEVLGDLIGVSKATMHRIEKGKKIPTDKEIENIAEALDLKPERLKQMFDEERKDLIRTKTLPHSGGFFNFGVIDYYIEVSEKLRMSGKPADAVDAINRLIRQIRIRLGLADPSHKPVWQGLLAKALVVRLVALTMILSQQGIRALPGLQSQLEELREYRSFIPERDVHYRDLAWMLPGMVLYLQGELQLAARWYRRNLSSISEPYVLGMVLRDLIVIAGRIKDARAYREMRRQAMQMIDNDRLETVDRARIEEGQAMASILLELPHAGAHLEKAHDWYASAELKGDDRRSIEAQIARTEIRYLVTRPVLDEGRILKTAELSMRIFQRGEFRRHYQQTKEALEGTELEKVIDFCASLDALAL